MIESKRIYEGRIFNLDHDKADLPNGRVAGLDVIRHPGASAMVCLNENNEVLMLRQYRYAAGGYIWEIPAGTLEKGEDPKECALREVEEETGYSASGIEKLGEMFPAPGYTDELIHVFLVTGLTQSRQNLDADEILEVEPVKWEKALEMAHDGTIRDAKTVCGLFWAAARMQK